MTEPYSKGKVPRKDRRVLLVLLTGATTLTHVTICKAADVPPGSIAPMLATLEAAGWVTSEWDPPVLRTGPPRRRIYHLTDVGRANALLLLGLDEAS